MDRFLVLILVFLSRNYGFSFSLLMTPLVIQQAFKIKSLKILYALFKRSEFRMDRASNIL